MGRRIVTAAAVLLAAAIIGLAVGQHYRTVDLGDRVATVIIAPGDSFAQVAARLDAQGVVPSPRLLRLAARLTGVDRRLIPAGMISRGNSRRPACSTAWPGGICSASG
ncbi:MAG TPA: hypothetical protein PK112_04610 [candidate division Zixibacteria bacterium]|nr:hypothetical protein [candidate division Zixibacteria bacterium]